MADLADRCGSSEFRVTYTQNIIIPHARRDRLAALYRAARDAGLHGAEEGLISDMIACPGLDYCNLANARSLPLAEKIFRQFPDPVRRAEIGRLRLNISGCINACGHHHAADIGMLGVNKKGVEHYQITLGGRADEAAAIGRIIGPSFAEDDDLYGELVERLEKRCQAWAMDQLDTTFAQHVAILQSINETVSDLMVQAGEDRVENGDVDLDYTLELFVDVFNTRVNEG